MKANTFDPISAAAEYEKLRIQQKQIEDRKSEIATNLKAYAESTGTKDDRGSHYVQSGEFIIGRMCKNKVEFSDDAIQKLKDMGLESCIDTLEFINEDELDLAYANGLIDAEGIQSITSVKPSYSVFCKRVEEIKPEDMPVIQPQKFAASKKMRLTPRR